MTWLSIQQIENPNPLTWTFCLTFHPSAIKVQQIPSSPGQLTSSPISRTFHLSVPASPQRGRAEQFSLWSHSVVCRPRPDGADLITSWKLLRLLSAGLLSLASPTLARDTQHLQGQTPAWSGENLKLYLVKKIIYFLAKFRWYLQKICVIHPELDMTTQQGHTLWSVKWVSETGGTGDRGNNRRVQEAAGGCHETGGNNRRARRWDGRQAEAGGAVCQENSDTTPEFQIFHLLKSFFCLSRCFAKTWNNSPFILYLLITS